MVPPVPLAYSLRVQLLSSTSCGLEDKPLRNFRIVTSPEITVREFCQEASRIHEINYGYPLIIKKVQDDQAFDVTQSEILGNLFDTSSIIRVVQASKHPGIRDSLPPTSALRFNPISTRKRERCFDDRIIDSENSWNGSKRKRLHQIYPDNPLPSRESEGIPSCMFHNQLVNAPHESEKNRHKNYNKQFLQISETPEPSTSLESQNSKKHKVNSITTQQHAEIKYIDHERSNDELNAEFFHNRETHEANDECASLRLENHIIEKSVLASTSSSVSLGFNNVENDRILSPRPTKILTLARMQNNDDQNSSPPKSHNKKGSAYDKEESENQSYDRTSKIMSNLSSEKKRERSDSVLKLSSQKVVENISRIDAVKYSPKKFSKEEENIEIMELENENHRSKGRAPEQQNSSREFEIVMDVPPSQTKKKKIKKLKNDLLKTEKTQKFPPSDAKNMYTSELDQKQKQSIQKQGSNSLAVNQKQNGSQELKLKKKRVQNKALLENPKSPYQTSINSVDKIQEESNIKPEPSSNSNLIKTKNSPSNSLNSASKALISSSGIDPPSKKKKKGTLKYSPVENSPLSQNSNTSKTPKRDRVDCAFSSLESEKASLLSKDNIIIPTKQSNQILSNTQALSEVKSSQKLSKKISSTPILPPKKPKDVSNILVAEKNIKSTTKKSKVSSVTTFLPPTKITPVIPPKRPQPSKPDESYQKSFANDSNTNELEFVESSSNEKKDLIEQIPLNGSKTSERKQVVSAVNIPDTESKKQIIYKTHETTQTFRPMNPNEIQLREEHTTKADEENCQGAQNQDSSDFNSRSPIEFHQNFQLPNSEQTPTLSSVPQSEDEDSRASDASKSALDASSDSPSLESHQEHGDQEQDVNKNNAENQLNSEIKINRPDSSHSISRVQIPNSSPLSKHNLVTNKLTKKINNTNNLEPSYPNKSSLITTQSPVEKKRSQFGFGTSLSAIHQNGGLIGMSQVKNSNSSEQREPSRRLEAEALSESDESETSSTSSPESQDEEKLLRPSDDSFNADRNSIYSNSESDSDSNTDQDDSGNNVEQGELEAKIELFTKINNLTESQLNSEKVNQKNIHRSNGEIMSSQNKHQENGRAKELSTRKNKVANDKYTQGYTFSQPTV